MTCDSCFLILIYSCLKENGNESANETDEMDGDGFCDQKNDCDCGGGYGDDLLNVP